MLILADENMPLVEEYFSSWGEIKRVPGRALKAKDLGDAEMLLVRSVTRVDKNLIEGSQIKMVGTATIGIDHLDTDYLESKGIAWFSAPGCNALSVAQYVTCTVAHLLKKGLLKKDSKVGVVGLGNVGSRVSQHLKKLGFEVLENDPPRAERESAFKSSALKDLQSCDLICFHTPLTRGGDHPTFHLVDGDFLDGLKKETVLLSAGRGEVLDFSALKKRKGQFTLCLDVWEPEPEVDLDMLKKATIATPHVAGYSIQSKWRGTEMLFDSFSKHRGVSDKPEVRPPLPEPVLDLKGLALDWKEVLLKIYDPELDSELTKQTLFASDDIGVSFDSLRKKYAVRHEFAFPVVTHGQNVPDGDVTLLKKLGLRFR